MLPNNYEIKERVGKGSFGQVFRAIDKQSSRVVAVKIIELEDSTDDMDDIRQEIRTLATLRSKWVIEYYASFVKNTSLWIVMEYCSAGSCLDMMKKYGVFNQTLVAIIMRECLNGLDYLHSHGKIHRDIKAANVLLTETGNVKLADFGVSGQITATISKKNTFVGTPYWIAPEVILRSTYNSKADIWSLGITCWELLHGLPPNAHIHPMKVLFKIPKEKPPRLPDTYPKPISDFVAKCLEMKQNLRSSANTLLNHEFISSAEDITTLELYTKNLNKTNGKQSMYESINVLTNKIKNDNTQKPFNVPWNFDSNETDDHLVIQPNLNPKTTDINEIQYKSLGKNVVFEDEFDTPLPEKQYEDVTPFGYDLLKTIIIPAFEKVKSDGSVEQNQLIDKVINLFHELGMKYPVITESACRGLLEDLLSSSRQSLKEFVASASNNMSDSDYDMDEQDVKRLNFRIELLQEEQSGTVHEQKNNEYKSEISKYLLNRWLHR